MKTRSQVNEQSEENSPNCTFLYRSVDPNRDKLLKESEGPDLNLKKAYQKDTLQEVFLTYFRILKHNDQNRFASLLPTVLLVFFPAGWRTDQGLSQYGHLLNTDVVIDLLKLLKIQLDQNFLSFESSLYCIKTCFKLLSV